MADTTGRIDLDAPPTPGQALVIDDYHVCIDKVEPDPGTEHSGDIYVTFDGTSAGQWLRYRVGGRE